MSTFGQRLKELRQLAHLTQAQLAKYLGMTRENISLYEHDKNKTVPDPVIKQMSELFNVPPTFLRGEQNISSIELSQMIPNEKLESWSYQNGETHAITTMSGRTIDVSSSEADSKDDDKKPMTKNQELIAYSIDPDVSDEERDAIIEMVKQAMKFRKRL